MPRPKRIALGGYVYHVLNRTNGRLRIFCKDSDFLEFERILGDGAALFALRRCGYCLLGNHWHLLLWPREDDDLSRFMRWVTLTHTQRYHTSHATVGIGHLYQGRYKGNHGVRSCNSSYSGGNHGVRSCNSSYSGASGIAPVPLTL